MSAASTAHTKMIALLDSYAPSPSFDAVYGTHETADLDVPSLSVEVDSDTPILDDAALVTQELVDNRLIRLSIRIHTSYRLGPVDTVLSVAIADDVIRWIREHINLADGYRVFDVAAAYNIEHASSGTSGAEVTVDIHKVEYYAQS